MTIHEASQQLRFQLFHIYDEREADNITDMVMDNITGWKKIDRVVNKTVRLTGTQEKMMDDYTKALLDHKPLQYVLHESWFYGMCLYVDENVLIPRPETEELVDWLVKGIANLTLVAGKSILDIGTGSGCIPLAIKKTLPGAAVHSCDISEGALNVAKKNAADQKLGIHFHLLDILSQTDRDQLPLFDIIISNPPYIPHKDKTAMAANVLQYEPHLALFVEDSDPLIFYKAIADFAKNHLAENGSIYLEIHEDMANPLVDLYKQKGFPNIELKKDLQGRDRMVRVSI
ncbi:MAG: peptide chain release factor N(5)-glutamine methyltransferase [Bacteroidota bacterium]